MGLLKYIAELNEDEERPFQKQGLTSNGEQEVLTKKGAYFADVTHFRERFRKQCKYLKEQLRSSLITASSESNFYLLRDIISSFVANGNKLIEQIDSLELKKYVVYRSRELRFLGQRGDTRRNALFAIEPSRLGGSDEFSFPLSADECWIFELSDLQFSFKGDGSQIKLQDLQTDEKYHNVATEMYDVETFCNKFYILDSIICDYESVVCLNI